jgi:HAD superfamily hydrolase (TIGR01484 family)
MLPFERCPPAQLAAIRGVFTDVDDTLTKHGRLAASTYAAIEALHRAGVHVIPITGGPASWAEHMARLWPVTAVIGESGAVSFARTPLGLRSFFAQSESERRAAAVIRDAVWQTISRQFAKARLASDQCFRLCDLAIDHGQEAHLSPSQVEAICAVLTAKGFTVRVSSIHINAWQGGHDKPEAACRIVRELLGQDLLADRAHWLCVGDSLNDQGLFELLPLSVGVANIARVFEQLQVKPTYVTASSHGAGFEEVASGLLAARRGAPAHVQ